MILLKHEKVVHNLIPLVWISLLDYFAKSETVFAICFFASVKSNFSEKYQKLFERTYVCPYFLVFYYHSRTLQDILHTKGGNEYGL